jgi:phospholipid/cholesterol/gamma-HCH transport system substrate-binding protein
MAMHRARAIAVGAFVIVGLVLFTAGLFLIGNRRMLFTDRFEVRAQFARISGLQVGATVRVAGMNAGEVKEIHVPAGPTGKFLVTMAVRSDLHPVVRTDSVASIQNDGLVGNKFVQIEAGTDAASQVADKGTIAGAEPMDLADLIKKMSDTVDAVNDTIGEVQEEVKVALAGITSTAQTAQKLVQEVGTDVRAITASGRSVTTNLNGIVADVRAGRGSVGKLLTDDALYVQARQISEQAQKAVANLREASEQAKQAIAEFRGEGGAMKGLTGNLAQTLNSARETMADLAENTEALKHSFFFRGFFNRRGYFDLDDVTVQQYRSGVLEKAGGVPLRIWLNQGVLFSRDPNGREVLTDEGRLRLASAMAQFVKYPKTSPLVVEGYATDATADARFLLSRQRAQLARDYVVAHFGLDSRYLAIMAMGSEAPNSPGGGTWDGVALTLFVPKEAFTAEKAVAQGLDGRN